MGKPLSRPGCFRKSSCCLEKHGVGDGGVGGRNGGMEGGYGDGYVPQRSIYETMCINQQIDSQHHHHHHHHHHPGGSVRRDVCGEGSFYSASGSLRVSRSPADMFDAQPRSLTPNPSFVRRLDERAIYDSLKLGAEDGDGGGCHSPGHFNRSVSPAVSSFSAPGVSSSSSKKHHHHHHHGDSTKSRDGRQSWKVLTPPKHLECMELTTNEVMDRGGGYLNPGHYAHPGGQSSSLTSPLISPFSGSPLSSGYHTPVFFSPAKPRPSQSQSLRCSPPQVIQPRHYSQTQSLRLSPPHELRRSPYRVPLVQLSAHDLEQDLRDRGGWGRSERERGWEREREREMERGWAQREWERERERGRLERERARERERKETTFATFGYGHPVPLCSDRDSVFLEPEQVRDTTPLLLPQPSPSPSPNAAPRMGTGAVGRNRAGSKVGSESVGGGMVSKFDNGSVGLVLVDNKTGCGPRLVSDAGVGNTPEAEMRAGAQEGYNKYDSGARTSLKNGPETRMGSQIKTRSGGWDLEEQVQSGVQKENVTPAVNKEGHIGGASRKGKSGRSVTKQEPTGEAKTPTLIERKVPREGENSGGGAGLGMKFEKEPESLSASRQVENRTETVPAGSAKVNNEFGPKGSKADAEVETEAKIIPACEPEAAPGVGPVSESGAKTPSEGPVVSKSQNITKTTDKAQLSAGTGGELDTVPDDPAQKTPDDIDQIECSPSEKRHKSKSSKSSSRTRPGTATGLRPGVFSPRLSKGLANLDSTGPAEGIESTWPRRLIVRKRTVRQGGALHNLPILPPLPSVLSALEKRRPLALHHLTKGHFSENPLSNVTDPTSLVGRCSLRESSHQEPVQGANLVGRASLKEQNLEHWRVYRDQEEPRRSRSREKHHDESTGRSGQNEKRGKEQKNEKECSEQKYKREGKVGDEKEKVSAGEGREEDTKPDGFESKVQENGNKVKELKKDREIMCEKTEDKELKMKDGGHEHGEQAKTEVEVEVEEGDTFGDEQGMESWDSVLEMVNTLWDDGWEKGEARGGDTDSLSGSLPRWPLLRPPLGFGGSHPPSSAASELSLTELERRARELDSDLEHLDLSQPHRDQTSAELQRERADIDMYQTHPGPQREKAALLAGVGSRSQVSLELSGTVSPATDSDCPAGCWSTRPPAGTSTVCSSSNKEDSSPDSNLTLESDSSGVFLSISNQSQEEAGSDSDQPVSGSDLGSSNTSLEKDGDDGGLKEWGREESAELQWCYPSLLDTSTQDDVEGDRRRADTCGAVGADEVEDVSIVTSPQEPTDPSANAPQSDQRPQRKNIRLMETDSPLPLAPSVQPIKRLLDAPQKPVRSSGLDCGDLDPFVQSDSFVYLAVSARPGSHGEISAVPQLHGHNAKQDGLRRKPHLEPSNLDQDSGPTLLGPHRPEKGDFLCTDSFVYLAAPACLLLGPEGTTPYSGRDSDSESSGSGPVDVSVLGCGSVAGDSDWDSDLSDSDPSRSSRISAVRGKRPLPEQGWDKYEETADPEVLNEFLADQDRSDDNGMSRKITAFGDPASPPVSMATQPIAATTAEQASTTKKVTWQFKPAQRSVCTGSRKEKEVTSSSSRSAALGRGEGRGPSPSSSSSSSPSSSSSD